MGPEYQTARILAQPHRVMKTTGKVEVFIVLTLLVESAI
jgi:hypothetical protein